MRPGAAVPEAAKRDGRISYWNIRLRRAGIVQFLLCVRMVVRSFTGAHVLVRQVGALDRRQSINHRERFDHVGRAQRHKSHAEQVAARPDEDKYSAANLFSPRTALYWAFLTYR